MADNPKSLPDAGRLYEADLCAWTQDQAEKLRASERALSAVAGGVDWLLIAQEIEDMGRAERNTALSLTEQIIAHRLKLSWTRNSEPRRGWKTEILAWRTQLKRRFEGAPSLRGVVTNELERLHGDALESERDFKDIEPAAEIDADSRWSLARILGAADDPLDA